MVKLNTVLDKTTQSELAQEGFVSRHHYLAPRVPEWIADAARKAGKTASIVDGKIVVK